MDDLVVEFLTETNESLDLVDVELVKFEQDPNNVRILDNVFRLVHTIKGTCGFLGLPRLEALAHAAESAMGRFRDGVSVTPEAVTLILESIDRLKEILAGLEAEGREPEGSDEDIIKRLEAAAEAASSAPAATEEAPEAMAADNDDAGHGEVSLDELERAFQEAPGPEDLVSEPEPAAAPVAAESAEADKPSSTRAGGEEGEAVVKTQSIRVNVDTLETLITTVSELVLTRNQLLEIVRRHDDSEFTVPLQRLSNVTAELQEGVMKTRMQPVGNAWQKLPRIVRDLANELGKDIELEMDGAETELDRQVLELIRDPLTHMVRNSADHGLEGPDARKAAGKSSTGHIRLRAHHEGGHIIIEVADDGRGLNAQRIRSKVLEKGLATEAELDKMSEAQIHRFIFAAGFSTAEAVTNVSGRGVGMDVVRTNIELIGGSVDVKSVEGAGTSFFIKIPLTLAIISALIVSCEGQRFAIPQISVMELVRTQSGSDTRIEYIKDTPVLRLRNQFLPLVRLSDVLKLDGACRLDMEPPNSEGDQEEADKAGFIVVLQVGSQDFGLVVDAVFHTEEIVVKPMSALLRDIPAFSGNTILGDGSVIMIIDPNGIAQAVRTDVTSEIAEKTETSSASGRDQDERVSLLVFRAGSEEPKVVPLSLITRLEEIDVSHIEHSNGREFVQYRGRLMPLIRMNDSVVRREEGVQPMIVFTDGDRSMGLVIDEIVDIVEDRLDIEIGSATAGVLGSAIIRDKATEVIDVGHYLPLAFDDWFGRRDASDRGRRVLFVEDSAFFRNMLTPVLRSAGYQVTVCENALQALQHLDTGETFDIVVTDIEMPDMNGYELAERINSDNRFDQIPVVALSAHATASAIERGRQAGFSDYVAKFDRSGLLATLEDNSRVRGEAA
jgi:two-component system, chemotaxis family, sensor kinase CheA